jgi:redox-sensing transcriptional repressor
MSGPDSPPKHPTIPEASLRRLPVYHRLLVDLMALGEQYVSCSVIARELRQDATQVRKDIEATGIVGKPKVGYPLPVLAAWIEGFLGWNNTKEAFLAGAGSMGSALMGYEKFRKYGLNIVAAFDADPAKIGSQIHGREVLGIDRLGEMAQRMHIHIGVIATPASAAQSVAELMVGSGIRAIWNFAPVNLRVPDSVIIQNEDLYPSLASLSFKLERQLKAEREAAQAIQPADHAPEEGERR